MSSRLTPLHVETGMWLLVCGGLFAGIGIETDWGRQLHLPPYSQVGVQGNFEKPALAEPFRLPPPDAMLETAMRPLFIVTRRPAPPPVAEAAVPTMNKGQFLLTGVTIVPSGKFAFLIEKSGNKNRVVSEGKEINGMLVKEILADRVVLTQNDDSEVLPLKTAKSSVVPPTPPSPQVVPSTQPVRNTYPPQPPQSGNVPVEPPVAAPPPPQVSQSAPPQSSPSAVPTPARSIAGPR